MKNSTTGTEQADNLAATGSGRGVLVLVCIAMFFGVLNASAVGLSCRRLQAIYPQRPPK